MKTQDPFEAFDALSQTEEAPPLRVLEALRAEMQSGAVLPDAGVRRTTRLVLSALWLFASLVLCSLGAATLDWAWVVGGGALFGLVFGRVLLGEIVPGSRRRLELGWRRVLLGALGFGLFALLAGSASGFLPLSEAFDVAGIRHAWGCGRHAFSTGLLGATGLLWLWRRTDPFTPGWTGGLLGAVAGVLGAFSVGLSCASAEGWHLLVAHGTSIIALALLSACVGSKWLRP